jgi:hypothetical protein
MTCLGPDAQAAPTTTEKRQPTNAQRVLVLFENRTECSWLRVLTPGFRHCFCVIGAASHWTIVDPLKSKIEVLSFSGLSERYLASHYHRTGRMVIVGETVPCEPRKGLLPRPLTCVEIVKRLLNLRAPGVFTPWQLHRTLLNSPNFAAYQQSQEDAPDLALNA